MHVLISVETNSKGFDSIRLNIAGHFHSTRSVLLHVQIRVDSTEIDVD